MNPCKAGQLKALLLKQEGKTEKAGTYDYAEENASAIASLSFIPLNSTIGFTAADAAKGKLVTVNKHNKGE
ncbi:MAG: hypothetical protein JST86_12160 [Bacteroidetes bacterium]|nr:hypothetical protein [Bacteroidota bacterium]